MINKKQLNTPYNRYGADILTKDLKFIRAIFHLKKDIYTIKDKELIELLSVNAVKIISIRKLEEYEHIY